MRRRAQIDLVALGAELIECPQESVDVRADAYGHGLALIAPVLREGGVQRLTVSDERAAELVAHLGFRDVLIGRGPSDPGATAVFGVQSGGHPLLSLSGELVAVKKVGADAGVSYGYTHRTSAPTTLGLVALGYADGVPRLASNRARVAVDGVQRPLVGRIAMDQFVVDLGGTAPPLGSEVTLFGDGTAGEPHPAEWAEWTERPALALTAGLGDRILRVAR